MTNHSQLAPEDALVVSEVLRRIRDVIGSLTMRADGSINHSELYDALDEEYKRTTTEV